MGTAVSVCSFVAGFLILARGLRGKAPLPVGFCGTCEYNLTGVTSSRCPECGSPVLNLVRTKTARQRQWRLIAVGSVCVIFGTAVMKRTVLIDQMQRHGPFAIVLIGAEFDFLSFVEELDRRVVVRELSNNQITRLADAALARARVTKALDICQSWINILDRLDRDGKFNATQRTGFHNSIVKDLTWSLEQNVLVGEPVRFSWSFTQYSCPSGINAQFLAPRVAIDGVKLSENQRSVRQRYSFGVGGCSGTLEVDSPIPLGEHSFYFTAQQVLARGQTVIASKPVEFTGVFNVASGH